MPPRPTPLRSARPFARRDRRCQFLAVPLVVLWILAAGLSAMAEERVLTPRDVVGLQDIDEAMISPSGELIAYVKTVPRHPGHDPDGVAYKELHIVDREGRSRPWVTGPGTVDDLSWTPDGQHVLFLAEREDDHGEALYAIPVNGGEARRVAVLDGEIDAYHLCSDGRRVALVSEEVASTETEELREQGFNAEIFEEDDLFSRVWISELATPGQAPVAPREHLPVEGSVERAAWSPDCGRLVLKVAPSPRVDDRLMFSRLHVVDAETGNVTGKIDTPGKLGAFAWSSDGRHLALITAADLHDPREGRLAVVAASGGQPRDLLPGLLGHVQAFAWQDDENLVFLVHEGVEARVGTVGTAGSKDGGKTLTAPGGPIFGSLSRAANGDLALVASTPSHPDEVFRLAAGARRAERLTDTNPWLSNVEMAPQEVVRFAARDGLELEGILIRPLNEKKNRRYPLILVVHGGPEAHHSNGWMTSYSRPGQTGAARGFAVFFINYRASTGRGVEFSKLDHGDPAGAEFDDLVDGVDHLIASGLVDRDKVAITGGSYGGYATAWGATYYSERFAAAVMSVGISEKIAKMGTSEIPQELYLVHERKWPWEDWQHALERSPVYHVEKAKTPILIIHGKKDTRVFPGQSMILYRAIKIATDTPVRLVFYPEEGHGNRRAAARLDYALRQLRWIEHYINGPGGAPPAWPIEDYGLAGDSPEGNGSGGQ